MHLLLSHSRFQMTIGSLKPKNQTGEESIPAGCLHSMHVYVCAQPKKKKKKKKTKEKCQLTGTAQDTGHLDELNRLLVRIHLCVVGRKVVVNLT